MYVGEAIIIRIVWKVEEKKEKTSKMKGGENGKIAKKISFGVIPDTRIYIRS